MAVSRYTKGLWMGGKWSTRWYRFIWSAIWVFLLIGFLGDQALLWLTRYSHLGLLFTLSVPVSSLHLTERTTKWNKWTDSEIFFIIEALSSIGEEPASGRLIWSSHTAFHHCHSSVSSDWIIDLTMQKNCYLIGKPHKNRSIIRWHVFAGLCTHTCVSENMRAVTLETNFQREYYYITQKWLYSELIILSITLFQQCVVPLGKLIPFFSKKW